MLLPRETLHYASFVSKTDEKRQRNEKLFYTFWRAHAKKFNESGEQLEAKELRYRYFVLLLVYCICIDNFVVTAVLFVVISWNWNYMNSSVYWRIRGVFDMKLVTDSILYVS